MSNIDMLTYWQQKVDHVHNDQNHMTDFCPAISVGDVHEEARHDVVGEHLRKVFPSFL